MKSIIRLFFMVVTVCLLAQCKVGKGRSVEADALPAVPDYQDTTQWYVSERHADADIFYVISTETGDYVDANGILCHYADTYNDSVRGPLYSEMLGVDTLLSGKLNYYSPYYRQCSLQTFTDDSVAAARFPLALDDVRRAFGYYLAHLNDGRPFILAGFSQGARMILELMKEMDDATFQRMIAAYAIGIGITQEIVDSCPRIVPAKGAGDTGVTISYNSVASDIGASASFVKNPVVAINPVNWRTDDKAVVFMTEPTPWLPVAEQKKDTLTVYLDGESNLLFVKGYTATDYVLPLIGKEGNYHSREIWLYRDFLRENMALRAANMIRQ
ncbi:MAG: DUF3089 domain-containing protein [Prevotella sp.]|nr:DUF3089 domain-containing protein [Prevotella sp.]